MTTSQQPFLEVPQTYYQGVFRWLRWSLLLIAVPFGCAAVIWKQYEVPLLVVPAVIAALGGAVIGWLTAARRKTEVLSKFASNFWVRIIEGKERSVSELDLFEEMVPEARDRRKIHRLRTDEGEIFLLRGDRFIELLVSRSMTDLDAATEHALGVAWHRSCGKANPQTAALLNKTFREVFKGDLSGSLVSLISKVGEKIIAELATGTEPVKEDAGIFTLEPLTVGEKRPRKPRKK